MLLRADVSVPVSECLQFGNDDSKLPAPKSLRRVAISEAAFPVSEAAFPVSEMAFPVSEAAFPVSELVRT